MFDMHIYYSFYEKLVGQPKFRLTCMFEYIFIFFWELWMDYFCEHIEYVLKTYGKSWLETQYGI